MTRFCLDTSAYSLWQRGHPEAGRLIDGCPDLGVPAIVIGELRAGFKKGNREQKNEAELRRFLANPCVRVLDVEEEAATQYAQIVLDLSLAGTPVPTNDIWIAAVALREGMALLTFDDHFSRIRRVGVHLLKP